MSEPTVYPELNYEPYGSKIRSIVVDRLGQLTAGGQYSGVNLTS